MKEQTQDQEKEVIIEEKKDSEVVKEEKPQEKEQTISLKEYVRLEEEKQYLASQIVETNKRLANLEMLLNKFANLDLTSSDTSYNYDENKHKNDNKKTGFFI